MSHKETFERTSNTLEALAVKLESPDYCEITPHDEFIRDISIVLEQGQTIIDTFTEIMDDIDCDQSGFKKYCEDYIKRHGERA